MLLTFKIIVMLLDSLMRSSAKVKNFLLFCGCWCSQQFETFTFVFGLDISVDSSFGNFIIIIINMTAACGFCPGPLATLALGVGLWWSAGLAEVEYFQYCISFNFISVFHWGSGCRGWYGFGTGRPEYFCVKQQENLLDEHGIQIIWKGKSLIRMFQNMLCRRRTIAVDIIPQYRSYYTLGRGACWLRPAVPKVW